MLSSRVLQLILHVILRLLYRYEVRGTEHAAAVKPGDTDVESKRGAAGQRRHARPGRRELPVEQHGWQAPERLLLSRQRAADAAEHAV